MEEKKLKHKLSNVYEDPEFPRAFYEALKSKWLTNEKAVATLLHQIFQPGKLPGKRLLDFGCGPTVHKMASASRQFQEIVVADYSKINRHQVEKWIKADPNCLDLTPLLETAATLEGFGVTDIERRLRERIKMIIHCDGLSKNILPKDIGKFDVITCFYCITAFAFSNDDHRKFLEKLSTYLNQHGVMIFITVFNKDRYFVHQWIDHHRCQEEDIKDIINTLGFNIINWYTIEEMFVKECLYTITKI